MGRPETAPNGRPEIILVGVVHRDPQGFDKAMDLLAELRPLVVSVEISPFSWHWRRRWQARWQAQFQAGLATLPPARRRHVAVQQVAAQIALPFEARAAVEYARRCRLTWQAVDINALAREHLPRYRSELLQPENLRHLTATPDGDLPTLVRREYERAARLLRLPAALLPLGPGGTAPQQTLREKVMAARITRLARRWSPLVHLGGWEHLVYTGEFLTLADFLARWQPQRLLLTSRCQGLGVGRRIPEMIDPPTPWPGAAGSAAG